jgi:hypothetical protein
MRSIPFSHVECGTACGQFRPLDKSPKIADNPTAYESEHVRLTVCGFSLRHRVGERTRIFLDMRDARSPVWVLAASHNGGTKWLCAQQSFAAENLFVVIARGRAQCESAGFQRAR